MNLNSLYRRISTYEREGKPGQKYDAAFETMYVPIELVSFFKEASRNVIFIFLFNKAG
jgi:hypothetical protein